jgi:hypothetical protein
MPRKPTAADAQLILKLYDLRREAEMRKARFWWMNEFAPRNAADFMKVAWAFGSQENQWLRQVAGYWSIAASFVRQGVLNEKLFLQPGFSGEMFLIFAKVYPFLKELRVQLNDPEVLLDVEKVALNTKWGRDRVKFLTKRLEIWREKKEQKAESQ